MNFNKLSANSLVLSGQGMVLQTEYKSRIHECSENGFGF